MRSTLSRRRPRSAPLADGGVTMKDMGILAYGNLVGQTSGQMLQKQIGMTGIRCSTCRTPARPAPPR